MKLTKAEVQKVESAVEAVLSGSYIPMARNLIIDLCEDCVALHDLLAEARETITAQSYALMAAEKAVSSLRQEIAALRRIGE